MVQDKKITTHKCELCGRWYDDRWQAEQCEDGCRDEQPHWTTDHPLEPGWYWIHCFVNPVVVQVENWGSGLTVGFPSGREEKINDVVDAKWWSEKIVPPQKEENNV